MSPDIAPAVFTPDTGAADKLVFSALIPNGRPTIGFQYQFRINDASGYNGSKCATHFGQNVPLEVARFAQSRAQLASSVPFRLVPVFPFRLMPILCAHFTPKISV